MTRGVRILLLASAAALLGCGERDVLVHDLVALLPEAETERVMVAVARLDLGTPAGRVALREGWSPREETGPEGDTLVWSAGARSTLEIVAPESGPAELRFRCRSRGGRRKIRIRANDEPVAPVRAPGGWRTFQRGFSLREGPNRIAFEYGPLEHGDDTGAVGAGDHAVACDSVHVDLSLGRAREDDGGLRIPPGGRVDWFLPVPPEGRLVLGDVEGLEASRLEVVQSVRGEERARHTVEAGDALAPIPLVHDPVFVTRLSLRARPLSDADRGTPRLRLADPAVRAPRLPEGFGERGARPDVLVYLVDTLRADALGVYGGPDGVSPRLDALAERSLVFERALAQSPWTRPSVASLFTGLHAAVHGVNSRHHAIPGSQLTLAEMLRDYGYETAAFITNGNVSRRFGFEQGFGTFEYLNEDADTTEVHQRADRVNEAVIAWLDARRGARPFFLYVHTSDPHGPYTPQPPERARFAADAPPGVGEMDWLREHDPDEVDATALAHLRRLYEAEVAQNDRHFGALLDALSERGLLEESLVVFTADHGEEFLEHGALQHGKTLYRELLRIPLVVKPPQRMGIAPRRVAALAQQVDVLPTVLSAVGLAPPPALPGRSLLDAPDAAPEEGFARVEVDRRRADGIVAGPWKLVRWHRDDGADLELYATDRDPAEQEDLAAERPETADRLLRRIDAHLAAPRPASEPPRVPIEGELHDRLRALGYLE